MNQNKEMVVKHKKPLKRKKKVLSPEKKALKKIQIVEKKKQLLRDHLSRELKYSEKACQKSCKYWEDLCENVKMKELKDDLNNFKEYLTRCMNRKSEHMNRVLEDMEIAEEQYQRNHSKQAQIIDNLIKYFDTSLNLLKAMYEKSAENLVVQHMEDMANLTEISQKRKVYFENIMLHSNHICDIKLTKLENDFSHEKDDLMYTHTALRDKYRLRVLPKMEKYHKKMVSLVKDLKEYLAKTKREEIYQKRMKRYESAQIEIENLENRIRKLTRIKENLRKTLTHYECETRKEIMKLKDDWKNYFNQYWELKRVQKLQERKYDADIRYLAYNGYNTANELKKLEKYGRLILGLASRCRTLETEEEKVLPFSIGFDEVTDNNHDKLDMITEGLWEMHPFWFRVSKVELNVIQLQDEKQKLKKENDFLTEKIKTYSEMQAQSKSMSILRISEHPIVGSVPVQEASNIIRKYTKYKEEFMTVY